MIYLDGENFYKLIKRDERFKNILLNELSEEIFGDIYYYIDENFSEHVEIEEVLNIIQIISLSLVNNTFILNEDSSVLIPENLTMIKDFVADYNKEYKEGLDYNFREFIEDRIDLDIVYFYELKNNKFILTYLL